MAAVEMKEVKVRRRFPIGVIVLISLAVAFILNPARAAEKTPQYACCAETELVYKNGDTQLAGVLLSPIDDGEYPAAVILQGASTSDDRSNDWTKSNL